VEFPFLLEIIIGPDRLVKFPVAEVVPTLEFLPWLVRHFDSSAPGNMFLEASGNLVWETGSGAWKG
jgi:hypothetical protein